jgi:hypothetical protein
MWCLLVVENDGFGASILTQNAEGMAIPSDHTLGRPKPTDPRS